VDATHGRARWGGHGQLDQGSVPLGPRRHVPTPSSTCLAEEPVRGVPGLRLPETLPRLVPRVGELAEST
jgi:hypothetical protein